MLISAVLSALVGCGTRAAPPEPAVPDAAAARRTLEAALDAWRAGRPTDPVPGSKPPIHVVDTHRPPGRTLDRFEVLGEVTGDAKRCFAVRLHYSGDDEPSVVRFVVFGLSPRFVFRQEDMTMMMRWDHSMTDEEEAADP